MADFWPHETAVSWLRQQMKKCPIEKGNGLEQMQKAFDANMNASFRYINAEYDVSGLCRSFPERLLRLKDAKGERLKY